jgi:hypothetical protein
MKLVNECSLDVVACYSHCRVEGHDDEMRTIGVTADSPLGNGLIGCVDNHHVHALDAEELLGGLERRLERTVHGLDLGIECSTGVGDK